VSEAVFQHVRVMGKKSEGSPVVLDNMWFVNCSFENCEVFSSGGQAKPVLPARKCALVLPGPPDRLASGTIDGPFEPSLRENFCFIAVSPDLGGFDRSELASAISHSSSFRVLSQAANLR